MNKTNIPHAKNPQDMREGMANLRHSLVNASHGTRATDERFRLLVDAVRDYGIFLLDPNGYIQSWNSGAERIKGYTEAEVIGKHFSLFYTQEDLQRNHPQHELELATKNGRYEEEGWRVRKNGTKFWANVVITPLKDKEDHFLGYAKVTRDLTERKEAEERLKLSEERARKMFEGVKDYAMIMLSPEGKIVSWNEGARRIKGYEPQDIIGKYFSIFYPEQDVQMGKCEYELKEATETGRFEDEGWRIRKDGTKFWASVLITAIRNDQGKLIGFSKVTRDFTDRKRADDLLKMAYASLEKRIEERTRQLTETNTQLSEAVKARDEFLSIASHELRTPLTPLKLQLQSFTHNVRRKTFSKISEDRLERMAETCDKAITRLASLIDNLLDVSRINTGRLILTYETFDLAEMSRDLLDRYKSEIISSKSEVTIDLKQPVLGTFDRLRMEQVFINLLTNALKYGSSKPLHISVTTSAGNACLVFQDQGLGIAKQDQERIFQRFERIDTNVNVGGMGLGLYITAQIVEAHGGTIQVESVTGSGSTFTVKVPLQPRSR